MKRTQLNISAEEEYPVFTLWVSDSYGDKQVKVSRDFRERAEKACKEWYAVQDILRKLYKWNG